MRLLFLVPTSTLLAQLLPLSFLSPIRLLFAINLSYLSRGCLFHRLFLDLIAAVNEFEDLDFGRLLATVHFAAGVSEFEV